MSESIHIDDISPSEPRQELTGDQIKRVKVIYAQVGHISCSTLEEWLVDFMRDKHPEREIQVWEWITAQFIAHDNGHNQTILLAKLIQESTKFAPIVIKRKK